MKKLNDFKYSNTNKRYYTLDYYFKEKYGTKVSRIPINAGFTCPNIDGTKAKGGCTFCNVNGSGDFAGNPRDDLLTQWEQGKQMMQRKWPDSKFIAYFQAFTNTYAPVDVLREKFETFVNLEECLGISIGTRSDCLEQDVVDLLAELAQKKEIMVEIGLQTSNDKTSLKINQRQYLADFEASLKRLRAANIDVVVHIINGLIDETYDDMMNTAKYLAKSDIQGIKIHLLHVMKETVMEKQLAQGRFELMDRADYINLVVDQLEVIPEHIVVHRLTGDAPLDLLIGPDWSIKKTAVINDIDKEMVRRDTYQGAKFHEDN